MLQERCRRLEHLVSTAMIAAPYAHHSPFNLPVLRFSVFCCLSDFKPFLFRPFVPREIVYDVVLYR